MMEKFIPERKAPKRRRLSVDKNVPIPEDLNDRARKKHPSIYPFEEMLIGDSFFCSDETKKSSVRARAAQLKLKVAIRTEYKGDIRGFRVWVTESKLKKKKLE